MENVGDFVMGIVVLGILAWIVVEVGDLIRELSE